MSLWVFDVDGVIVDTKKLVFASYQFAGCPMPEDKFGVHWTKWMPDACGGMRHAEAIHRDKTKRYIEMLEAEKLELLPGYDMQQALANSNHGVYFITSMAEEAAEAVFRNVGLNYGNLMGVGLKHEERAMVLATIKRFWRSTENVYVDDRIEGKEIATEAGFKFTHADWSK